MDIPLSIQKSVKAIWLCIGLTVLGYLLDRLSGKMATDEFMTGIIIMGIFVMVPYKLSRRSNPTRYVYAVLMAIGLLAAIGGVGNKTPLFTMISSVIQLPITVAIFMWLFSKESNAWFDGVETKKWYE
jgi:hypothetical protein